MKSLMAADDVDDGETLRTDVYLNVNVGFRCTHWDKDPAALAMIHISKNNNDLFVFNLHLHFIFGWMDSNCDMY